MIMHSSHPNIIARLTRARDHLAAVLTIFEQGRSCLDLAQQPHAVESAVANAKRELIHDHMEHCLFEAGEPTRETPKELKKRTKYL